MNIFNICSFISHEKVLFDKILFEGNQKTDSRMEKAFQLLLTKY